MNEGGRKGGGREGGRQCVREMSKCGRVNVCDGENDLVSGRVKMSV